MQLPPPPPIEINIVRGINHFSVHLYQPVVPAELGRQREPHS